MVTPNIKKGVNILDRYADLVKRAGNRWDRRADKAFEIKNTFVPSDPEFGGLYGMDRYYAIRDADRAEEEAKQQYIRLRKAQDVARAHNVNASDLERVRDGESFYNPDSDWEYRKRGEQWFPYGSSTGNPIGVPATNDQMVMAARENPRMQFFGPVPGERNFIPKDTPMERLDARNKFNDMVRDSRTEIINTLAQYNNAGLSAIADGYVKEIQNPLWRSIAKQILDSRNAAYKTGIKEPPQYFSDYYQYEDGVGPDYIDNIDPPSTWDKFDPPTRR